MSEKKSNKKIIIILIAVIILLIGGGATGYFFFLKGNSSADGATAKPVAAPMPLFLEIEPMTVNLHPTEEGVDNVLYVAITLELETDNDRKNLFNYLPEVNTRLLYLISSKSKSELETLDGKLKLAEEIKTVLSQPVANQLSENKIKNVAFNKFILR